MKAIILVLIMIVMSGCAQLSELMVRSADKGADLVEKYCESTDEANRLKFRTEINDELARRGSTATIEVNNCP